MRANLSPSCRFDGRRWLKIGEAVSAAAMSALIFITLIYALPDCQPIRGFNTTTAGNLSCLHDVTATTTATTTTTDSSSSNSLTLRNSTDDDVAGARDVTAATPGSTSVGEHREDSQVHEHDSYGYHAGHGYVFQV